MPKYVIADDLSVDVADGHPGDLVAQRAGVPVLPVEASSFDVPVEFFVYRYTDGIKEILDRLASYEDRVTYCKSNLDLVARYIRR